MNLVRSLIWEMKMKAAAKRTHYHNCRKLMILDFIENPHNDQLYHVFFLCFMFSCLLASQGIYNLMPVFSIVYFQSIFLLCHLLTYFP
jgi:hypothetical protein